MKRKTVKGHKHLVLSAKRRKKGGNLTKNNKRDQNNTELEPEVEPLVRTIEGPSMSSPSNHPVDAYDSCLHGTKEKRKITMSTKRKKKSINLGLLRHRIYSMEKNLSNSNEETSQLPSQLEAEANSRTNFGQTAEDHYIFTEEVPEISSYLGVKGSSMTNQTLLNISEQGNTSSENDPIFNNFFGIEEDDLPPLNVVKVTRPSHDSILDEIKGRFIIDGSHFLKQMLSLQEHRDECLKSTNSYYKFIESTQKNMIWKIIFQCPYCKKTKIVTSEPENNTTPESNQTFSLAESAVWGFMAIGGGHQNMEEVFSTMGLTPIDKKTFQKKEQNLGIVWKNGLIQSMMDAGAEEKRMAIECGDVSPNGTPFITVVVDGGWSQRSFGHRYTAKSGVACVIGLKTKKLLHLDVRNKYCSKCEFLKKKGVDTVHDNCYKNWQGASPSMETDILVNAFRSSYQIHGIEYLRMVGDGDSSVFKNLQEKVAYGRRIIKIECANHAVKNYTKSLFNLKKKYKFLTAAKIELFKKLAKKSIFYNSKNGDSIKLKEDLRNGVKHVLGIHVHCKNYYCTKVGSSDIVDCNSEHENLIANCIKPLIRKASQLITNNTSNLAENFMSLTAKFVGGKQINRSNKNSYSIRTHGAGLDFQFGPSWHYDTIKNHIGRSPHSIIKRTAIRRASRIVSTKKCLFRQKYRRKRFEKDANRIDYGDVCQKIDIDPQTYEEEKTDFLNRLYVNEIKQKEIEKKSRGQFENDTWVEERKNRVTSSNFGLVCKRKKTSKWAPLVKRFLYSPPISCRATEYGKSYENVALKTFSETTGKKIKPCGLFVDLQHGFLATSPDGLVEDEDALVEVKCPFVARNQTISSAISEGKINYLDRNMFLKKTHNYFYQIQGQLNITGKKKCYFIVYTSVDLHSQCIEKDENFWSSILPKLHKFYFSCMLPEIIDPRACRSMPIREPNEQED